MDTKLMRLTASALPRKERSSLHPDSRPLKVGAVSYLNTKPLVYRLTELAPGIELIFDVPSRLADQLTAGQLDVALIPSIAYLRSTTYQIVSNACIACQGPVLSVKLLSRRPLSQIRTLALDEGSRTSAVLVRILLARRFGLTPEIQPLPLGADEQNCSADAVLLIGDRAIHAAEAGVVEQWDLGAEWCRWSGLPFVFAMWVGRQASDLSELAVALAAARDAGVAHLPEIAHHAAPGVGLSTEQTLTYLRDNLHFYLGPQELRGLDLYRQYASELGELPLG